MTYFIPVSVELLRWWRSGASADGLYSISLWISNLEALDSYYEGEVIWPEGLYAFPCAVVVDRSLGFPGELPDAARRGLTQAGYFGELPWRIPTKNPSTPPGPSSDNGCWNV